jgi:hypothetical protein
MIIAIIFSVIVLGFVGYIRFVKYPKTMKEIKDNTYIDYAD